MSKDIKKIAKKVGNVSMDVAKVGVALVAAVATAEFAFLGANMAVNDAEFGATCIKHKVDPEPVYIKKGLFGKKEVKTINPWNGKIEEYKGSKQPDKRAVIILKK